MTLQSRRSDDSMSLLGDVIGDAVEPEYATSTTANAPMSKFISITVVVALVSMLVMERLNTADDRAAERREVIKVLVEGNQRLEQLQDEAAELDDEVSTLTQDQAPDPTVQADLALLEPLAGVSAAHGPGVIVVVDDGPTTKDERSTVLASDLSNLVNGLRQAGAEAVAISGHRITTTTPIRSAGSAITVDYVSLSPPYTVYALGDPQELEARFGRTASASWWLYLQQSFGIQFSFTRASGELDVPGQNRSQLQHAMKGDS